MKATGSTGRRRSARRYSVADRERLKREHAKSGQTKKEFCEARGISLQTFYGWGKLSEQREEPAFTEVEVSTPASVTVEILLPEGVRVQIGHHGSPEELAALIRGVVQC